MSEIMIPIKVLIDGLAPDKNLTQLQKKVYRGIIYKLADTLSANIGGVKIDKFTSEVIKNLNKPLE